MVGLRGEWILVSIVVGWDGRGEVVETARWTAEAGIAVVGVVIKGSSKSFLKIPVDFIGSFLPHQLGDLGELFGEVREYVFFEELEVQLVEGLH